MYTVSPLQHINFEATGVEAILQNVAFIIATFKNTCPLDREFGNVPPIDAPITAAQSLHAAQLVEAIQSFEPRAEVVEIDFEGDPLQGIAEPKVTVTINAEQI